MQQLLSEQLLLLPVVCDVNNPGGPGEHDNQGSLPGANSTTTRQEHYGVLRVMFWLPWTRLHDRCTCKKPHPSYIVQVLLFSSSRAGWKREVEAAPMHLDLSGDDLQLRELWEDPVMSILLLGWCLGFIILRFISCRRRLFQGATDVEVLCSLRGSHNPYAQSLSTHGKPFRLISIDNIIFDMRIRGPGRIMVSESPPRLSSGAKTDLII